jgi:hypothetical protein
VFVDILTNTQKPNIYLPNKHIDWNKPNAPRQAHVAQVAQALDDSMSQEVTNHLFQGEKLQC